MTVLTKNVGRGDFIFHRGSVERIAIEWKEDKRDGKGLIPVDLSKWKAKLELSCPSQGTTTPWYTSTDAKCCSYGVMFVEIPASTLNIAPWNAYSNGEWRILGTSPQGKVELLAWGYYEIV